MEVLENSVHSHLILCRGPRVSQKIEESTHGGVINFNQLKAELCNEICGDGVSEIGVDSLSLTLHGRNRNMLKVECVNTFTRNFLIKRARSRKPSGIYVVEFLPSDKVPIYRSLHMLRKEHTIKKILRIQIRGTHIYCQTEVENRFIQVNSLTDIEEIRKQLNNAQAASNGESTDGN